MLEKGDTVKFIIEPIGSEVPQIVSCIVEKAFKDQSGYAHYLTTYRSMSFTLCERDVFIEPDVEGMADV